MPAGTFKKNTAMTIAAQVLTLFLGLSASVILARVLGPGGKGIYSLAVLLPALIITFVNWGIGPSTAYHVAKNRYSVLEILGNNIVFALVIGCIGIFGGLIVVIFFPDKFFPGVPTGCLVLALILIPANLFFLYLQTVFQGMQRFKEYNLIGLIYAVLFLSSITFTLWIIKAGVSGAIMATLFAWILTDIILFYMLRKVAGGVSFKLDPAYFREASAYGIQFHLGNIIGFLNYKIDMFLLNSFLNPAAVGYYSIGVTLVEKLWLVSQSASTVLFPKIAAENEEQKRNKITPLVARSVFWISISGGLMLFFLSRWIVVWLYSPAYLPSVQPLQILLPGIVFLSVGRVLANDIAGRGRPILNTCLGGVALIANIILNILWIPGYGVSGAALASTVSYGVILLGGVIIYCHLSGSRWTKIFLPQTGDWGLYRQSGAALGQWILRGRK